MSKRVISLLLALAMVLGLFPVQAFATEEADTSVDVTFSISLGTGFHSPEEYDEVLIQQKLTVPYFDLALYGLEEYYYNPDCYGAGGGDPDTQVGGTAETAEGVVTAMHLFIYATEVFRCNVDPDEAGEGYLKDEGLIAGSDEPLTGSELLSWSGNAGSSFMSFWGDFGTNLNYYINYKYPLGASGWGSTSDQEKLSDGDIVTLHGIQDSSAMGTNFTYFKSGETVDALTVTQGTPVTLTLYHTAADYTSFVTGATVGAGEKVYRIDSAELSDGDPSKWTEVGTTGADGTISIDTTLLPPGVYFYGAAGFDTADGTMQNAPGSFVLTVRSEEPAEPPVVAVESVTLDQTSLELEVGGTAQLTATVLPEDATDKTVTWASSNEAAATVADGVVTAVGQGDAVITAKAGDKTAECTVAVKQAPAAEPFELNITPGSNGSSTWGYISNIKVTGLGGVRTHLWQDSRTLVILLDDTTADDATINVTFEGAGTRKPGISGHGDVTLVDGEATMNVNVTATFSSYNSSWVVKLVKDDFPVLAEGQAATGTAGIVANTNYELELAPLFTDPDGDALTYKVKVNDGEYTAIEGTKYSYTNNIPGTYTLTFLANDGYVDSQDTYTVTLTIENSDVMYDVQVNAPEVEDLKFYITNGIDENGNDALGQELTYADGKVTIPENITRISWRAEGMGACAEVSKDAPLNLQKLQLKVIAHDTEDTAATAVVSYGDYKAVTPGLTFLLAAGEGYTYTVTPSADFSGSWSAVTLDSQTVTDERAATVEVKLTVKSPKTITVDEGAEVKVYYQSAYYVMREVKPAYSVSNEDGTTTYAYSCPEAQNSGRGYMYFATKEGLIDKAGYLTAASDCTVTWEGEERTGSYRGDYDTSTTYGSRGDDSVLVNVNGQSHLVLAEGQTFRLRSSRIWEIINSDTMNVMIEPQYTYDYDSDIISMTSANEVLTNQSCGTGGNNWMDISVTGSGVTFLEVGYEAVHIVDGYAAGSWGGASGQAGDFTWNAIDPARTALVVVQTDGKAATDVSFGIDCFSSNVSGNFYEAEKAVAWDYEFDTLYFVGDSGEMKLAPTAASGSIAEVAVSWDKGVSWTVLEGAEGTYTAEIKSGNNVIRVTKDDGTTAYQVVRGDKVTYEVSLVTDADESGTVTHGDTVRVTFQGMHMPVGKMSGIYNPGFGQGHRVTYTFDGEQVRQSGLYQYNFVSNAWIEVTIGTDVSRTYSLTDGYINFNNMGDGPGSHRNLTDSGRGVNMSAGSSKFTRCILPDVVLVEAPEPPTVTFQGHSAQVNSFKVYTYTDGVKGDEDLLEGVTDSDTSYTQLYTTELPVGDYWLEGYDTNGALNGSIVITVTEDGENLFQVYRAYSIYATNRDADGNYWVLGEDYKVSVTVTNQDKSVDRQAVMGTADAYGTVYPSALCLHGDTVKVTYTPIGEYAEDYLEVFKTATMTANSSSWSQAIPSVLVMTFTAPEGSTVDVGKFHTYYIYDFYEPAGEPTVADGKVTYTFRVAKERTNAVNGPFFFYRVRNDKGVTYWDFFDPATTEAAIEITAEELFIGSTEFTSDTIYRFEKNTFDRADIYMNINGRGYMDMEVGESYELNMFRNWMAIENFYNRKVALPDMTYTVIDTEGNPSDLLTITPDGKNSSVATMTANGEGTAIVLVTYDAMYSTTAYVSGTPNKPNQFSAIWPEATGVFVVSVGADGTAIETNMTMDRGETATNIDAEHDILFYLGDAGASYSFAPAENAVVTVARSTLTDESLTFSGFTAEGVTVDDGTVTVTGLTTGRHIIKVEVDGLATYQVVTARAVSYELQDADGNVLTEDSEIRAGETVYIQFSGLLNPAEKMSGAYNFNARIRYEGEDGTVYTSAAGGAYGVYDFSGNPVRQKIAITIPKYWTKLSYSLDGGAIAMAGNANVAIGGHRGITYARGLNAGYNAPTVGSVLSYIPGITLDLAQTDFLTGTLTFQDENGSAIDAAKLTIGLADTEGNVITVAQDGTFLCLPGDYNYTIKGSGIRYAAGSVTVTADGGNKFVITLVSAPETTWDGITETEPETDENGLYLISNGAELAWFSRQNQLNAADISGKLIADIDLGDYPWNNTLTSSSRATNLDGDGHEITGLNAARGLFGALGSNSQIRDLTIRGHLTGGGSVTAQVSGTDVVIENVYNYAVIDSTTTTTTTGGIVGTGGTGLVIRGCANFADITSSAGNVGGIIGTTSTSTIERCFNLGDLTGTTYVGGIFGNSGYAFTVKDCYNTGAVTGTNNVGGVAGYVAGPYFGTAAASLTNCYNAGTVSATNVNLGGVAGYLYGTRVTVSNCYYLEGTCASDKANASVRTDAEMKSADFVTELGEAFKLDAGLVNQGYPVLQWQVSEAPISYLSALSVTENMSVSVNGTAGDYAMTPGFHAVYHDYTILVPDNLARAYAWATLSEDAPEGSTIVASWTDAGGRERTANITSGKSSGQYLNSFVAAGSAGNTLTIQVGVEGDMQTYTVTSVRTPTLSGLSLAEARFNETFAAATTAYTASTTGDFVTVNAVPYDESSTVTYNGSESNVVTLADGENTITVVVSNDAGYEQAYTITVNKVAAIEVTFDLTPADAVVNLTDSFGDRVWADDRGVYTLMAGSEYTYTVTKSGWIGQKNTFSLTESGVIEVVLTQAEENTAIDKTIYAQWANFRNGDNHLGITDAPTPYAPEDAELLWAARYGTGWSAAPGSPIIVDECIITYVGTSIKKLDLNTGAVVAEANMVGQSSFSIVPATYADGMIFVGLSGGRIQAFNADTLESLWVYSDPLGGQPNCPITYKDGYIYAGFWNSENRDANFAAISVTDEDVSQTTEAKLSSWTYKRMGGFYWAGAYATDKYVVVGTDDGASGCNTESASLLVFDRITGQLIDSRDGIRGDIRSNVSYDPDSDRVFFTSKGGVLSNARIDWTTGQITDFDQIVITNANGGEYAMSTCTPSVYNDRIYIGVSGTSQFGSSSGHAINVYDLAEDGTMTLAYSYAIVGYPQTSAMVTTAYEAEDGYVYIYLPYNMTPGGISVLKDKKGQTEPLTTTDSGYSEVFTPAAPLNQYAICSTIADQYGTIYYKNDSLYMMAVTSKIQGLTVTRMPTAYSRSEDGTWTVEGLEAATDLANGMQRDVSDYVTIVEEDNMLKVTYTYGFDHVNYGLKTLTVDLISVCDAIGHDYTTVTVAPTCDEQGYDSHTCQRCGHNVHDMFVDALGHKYESQVTAPTCTELGYTTHTCAVCGDSYTDSYVAPTGHTYTSEVTKEATCAEEGVMTYTCECGHSYTEAIARAEHQYESVVTAPTCESVGYTTHTCAVCGDSYVDSIVEAKGHDYTALVTEPTCTAAGYTTYTCACGDTYVDDIVEAKGHNYTDVVTEPTHDKMGYTTHTCQCGHSYVDAYVDALGHDYTAKVTLEPTCTTEGIMTFTCACGETYTEAIPVAAHEYTAAVTEPTCESMGYTTYTCACGESYIADYVDALGHDCQTTVVEATCEGYGYTINQCVNGDHSYISSITEPTGHTGETVGTVEAGWHNDGYTGDLVCSVCGQVLELGEVIPAMGCPSAIYTDVDTTRWYHEAVDYVTANGLMNGTGHGLFQPDSETTRAMMATLLYRIAGEPSVEGLSDPFVDVPADKWYTNAVIWAASEGIVKGVSAEVFAPDESITRQQMVTMLHRFAGEPEADLLVLADYTDGETVSDYSVTAMAWAVETGLINGVNEDTLAPKGTAARAQIAAILMRYLVK